MTLGISPCRKGLYKIKQIASFECSMWRQALEERATRHGGGFREDNVHRPHIERWVLGATSSSHSRTQLISMNEA